MRGRGMIALFTFIILGTTLVSFVSAKTISESKLQTALKQSIIRRRLFYNARAIEDVFWGFLKQIALTKNICNVESNEVILSAISKWADKNGAKTGWLDIDGNLHAGDLSVESLIEILPGKLSIIKKYPYFGRDVIFVPVFDEGFSTYALMASGEFIEIEC